MTSRHYFITVFKTEDISGSVEEVLAVASCASVSNVCCLIWIMDMDVDVPPPGHDPQLTRITLNAKQLLDS